MLLSVFVAILLSEVRRKISMKIYQTVLLLPYMISMVIVSYLGYAFMAEDGGLLNRMLTSMGKDSISWYNAPQYWPVILTVIQLWKNVGYQSIIFLAAVMGIDQEMYEAAYGIVIGKEEKVERIEINVYNNQAKYFRSLPLHSNSLRQLMKQRIEEMAELYK